MRSEYVRGKTPDELVDIFALPNKEIPIGIVSVTMPASPDPATGKIMYYGPVLPAQFEHLQISIGEMEAAFKID